MTAVPRPFALDLSVWTRGSPQSTGELQRHELCRIRHFQVGGNTNRNQLPFGRLVRDSIDIKAIQSWLSICDHSHRCRDAGLASQRVNAPSADFVFRVVDVATRSVIDAPPGCVYAALSYVWGDLDLATLNARMMPSMQGYMLVNEHSLPQSVTDPVELCQDLGIPYLWVDCLCIPQNNPHDKHVQINNMERIYSEAYLTIASAMGFDANSGLPSVNPGSRTTQQLVLQSDAVSLITTTCNPELSMLTSQWYSRGWTFQEFLLSRRTLVFTAEQTLFCCSEAFWAEDTMPQDHSPVQTSQLKRPEVIEVLRFLRADAMLSGSADDVFEKLYIPCVNMFTVRRLSRMTDALDAFAGIRRVIEPFLCDFFWGIPIQFLSYALLWYGDYQKNRRNHAYAKSAARIPLLVMDRLRI